MKKLEDATGMDICPISFGSWSMIIKGSCAREIHEIVVRCCPTPHVEFLDTFSVGKTVCEAQNVNEANAFS